MILLYHHIAPPEKIPGDATRFQNEGWLCTHSPAAFEFHLSSLQKRGFRFISLGQLVAEIQTYGTEQPNSVVITFDDGWLDNYEFAAPILKKLGLPATVFVTTAHLPGNTPDSKRMTTAQLRELIAAGWTLGAHTQNHRDLIQISESEARTEIAGSKADLENVLGAPVDFFAYPGGAFNRQIVRLTREAGYKAACSVLGPKANDHSSLFWLYRSVLSPGLNTPGDRYRLSSLAQKLFSFRITRKLNRRLNSGAFSAHE